MTNEKPTLGIVGAGKAGSTLARLWSQRGYRITAVNSRTPEHMYLLAKKVDARAANSAIEVIAAADLTLFTVPDDVIVPLSESVAEICGDLTGKAIIHTSGSHGAESLNALANRGALTGGLHPAFPFADIETSIAKLPGATFALETSDARLRNWLYDLTMALDGRVLDIPHGKKALYHAALTVASNYAVTLYAQAQGILLSLGAERSTAEHALNVLVGATADNLRAKGIPDALTGALVRGDVGTVAAHIAALENYSPPLATLYIELARLTLPLLEARGVPLEAVQEILGKIKNASHSP
jgi:predicted short-subunit dehydrogenase-like oxidoreductase (DUF2520 family)